MTTKLLRGIQDEQALVITIFYCSLFIYCPCHHVAMHGWLWLALLQPVYRCILEASISKRTSTVEGMLGVGGWDDPALLSAVAEGTLRTKTRPLVIIYVYGMRACMLIECVSEQ